MKASSVIEKGLPLFRSHHVKLPHLFWFLCALALSAGGAVALGMKGLALGVIASGALYIVWRIAKQPWLGMAVIAFVLPFERFGSVDISGFTFRASQLFLIATLVAVAVHLLMKKIQLRFFPAYTPLALFFVGVAVSLPFALNSFRAFTSTAFIFFTMTLVLIFPLLIKSRAQLLTVLQALLLGAIVTSLFGMFQFAGDLAGLPQEITGLRDMYTKEVFGFPRIQSTALEPLYFANYLLLPIAVSIVVLLRKVRELMPYALALLPLALPVFVLTLSRAAFIAGAVMVVFLGLALLRHVVKPSYIILGLVLGVVTFVGVTYALSLTGDEQVSVDTFSTQVTNLFAGASFFDRAATTEQAIALSERHPLGVGPGNFGPAVTHHPLIEPKGGWLIVNNIYLEVLAEEGVLGLLGFLGFLGFLLFAGFRAYRLHDVSGMERKILLAAVAAVIGICIQYLTFSILYIMHVWFAFALLLTLIYWPKKSTHDN